MSSLDRAFFRAYAKDQPAETPAAPEVEPDVSPYVHFESQRRQLRYRIEPAHTWGQAVAPPHADRRAADLPLEEDIYPLAPPLDEPETPSAWSAQPVLHLRTQQYELNTIKEPPRPLPASAAPRTPKPAPAAPPSDGILCLPGVDVPQSDYLASLLHDAVDSVQYVDTLLQHSTILRPPESEAVPSVEPIGENLDLAVAATALAAAPAPVATEVAEPAAPPAAESAVLWEVDRYLYPEITDRLLGEYAYFQQAGEKLKQASAAGLKVLAITGVERDEGRTTLAITMARAAAKVGLKVGLVDCDFSRPHLAAELGLEVASSWHRAAAGNLALAEVTVRSLDDGIVLLPLTDDAAKASLHWSDDAVRRVVDQIAATLDVVVLDLGPLGPSGLAADKKLPFDAAIVVWDCRHRRLEDAQTIARRLSAAGVEAVGIAENYASA